MNASVRSFSREIGHRKEEREKEVDLFRDKAVKSRWDQRDTAVIYPLDISYRGSMIPLQGACGGPVIPEPLYKSPVRDSSP